MTETIIANFFVFLENGSDFNKKRITGRVINIFMRVCLTPKEKLSAENRRRKIKKRVFLLDIKRHANPKIGNRSEHQLKKYFIKAGILSNFDDSSL